MPQRQIPRLPQIQFASTTPASPNVEPRHASNRHPTAAVAANLVSRFCMHSHCNPSLCTVVRHGPIARFRHARVQMAIAQQHVPPTVGTDAFNCPACTAYAHQTWFRAQVLPLDDDDDALVLAAASEAEDASPTIRVFSQLSRTLTPTNVASDEMLISECARCRALAIWMHGRLVWPHGGIAPPPNHDLPDTVRHDYEEASAIARASPRGAAALLRLAMENLCSTLVPSANNLNDGIRRLVRQGLDPEVQQALDAVRVIGNNAVHPGEIDLKDDTDAVAALFQLVNFIAEQTITKPKNVKKIYDALPTHAKTKIGRRDANGP